MLTQLQKNWFLIKGGSPGKRFHDFYRHRQMQRGHKFTFAKFAMIGVGLAIIALGIVLIPVPGPGSAITILGLALLGSEFEPVARGLDWLEKQLRPLYDGFKKRWEKIPGSTRAAIEVGGTIIGLITAYLVYVYFFAQK